MSLLAWEAALPAVRSCQPHRPGLLVRRSANAAGGAASWSAPGRGNGHCGLRSDPPLATCCWRPYGRPPRAGIGIPP